MQQIVGYINTNLANDFIKLSIENDHSLLWLSSMRPPPSKTFGMYLKMAILSHTHICLEQACFTGTYVYYAGKVL